ncbi:hypothetical protein NL108_016808 [Boleophthalmus pectinirostris]|uniref:emerin (Emery-Dreifuss muscular dystrophy) n=1 Tax=Boleophthalmus pectinirostris TaxID=150288 RepID=UPI002432BA2A|nr:emerin (Emery-Dreifuss muscular dystrophy) [Boleophthalmus pectinirostris]KAJ0037145.1 hypothetical protein NL108_016808 [Boleophthalmus pectinirostris]
MSLSDKSDSEISELLSEYGIKHGPIVESTRKLYEKKLQKAMEEAASQSPSSDKTYYREEEEVITYITYHSPTRSEASGDMLKHRGATLQNQSNHQEQHTPEPEPEPPVQRSTGKVDHISAPSKAQEKQAKAGCVWRLMRLLLVGALLAALVFYVYGHLMRVEESQEPQ